MQTERLSASLADSAQGVLGAPLMARAALLAGVV